MLRHQSTKLVNRIQSLLKTTHTPNEVAIIIGEKFSSLELDELTAALQALEERNLSYDKESYAKAILETVLFKGANDIDYYARSIPYVWFDEVSKLTEKLIRLYSKFEIILKFTDKESKQLKENITTVKKKLLQLANRLTNSSSAHKGCETIDQILAKVSCDTEEVEECFRLYQILCESLYSEKQYNINRNPEYADAYEREAMRRMKEIISSANIHASTLADPIRKKHFVKLFEIIDDEMRIHYSHNFRAYQYFDQVPKEFQTLERQRNILCLTFEVALQTPWGQSQSPEEFLFKVYDYLNQSYDEVKEVERKCLRALVSLPTSLTGINQNDLPLEPNYLMNCNVSQFEVCLATALSSLRKHLLKTDVSNIKRNVGVNTIEKTLAEESVLYRRWLGVINTILENLKEKDVSAKSALKMIKTKIQKSIEKEKFSDLLDIVVELKDDVVIASSIKTKLNEIVWLMNSGLIPTDEIYREITGISSAREEFVKLWKEIEVASDAVSVEFSSLKSNTWAPQTCLDIKKAWDAILARFKEFRLTMEKDSYSQHTLASLREFLREVKDFPNANAKFKTLRCVKEVYARRYGKSTLDDPKGIAYTYLQELSHENHISEVTFDIVKLYLKNKIVSTEQNSRSTKEISLLLKRIEEAVNMDAVLMAVYDYLADFQKEKTTKSEKMETTILNVLLNIPQNETGLSKSLLPHGALDGSIIKSNLLQQLQGKLAAINHEVRLGETSLTLTLSKELNLLKKWKGIAITIGEKLTQNDFTRFVLFRNTVNIVDIQKEIENAESYSELFCVLQKLRKLCTSNNLQSTLDSTLSNMSKGIDPTEKAIKIILAEENFNELFDKLSKQIENLQNEFDSWNGVLWDIVNNSFISSDQNLTYSMGSLVEKEIQALRESKDKIIARKKYLATGQLTIEKLLSEAKVLSGKIETFTQSESFKTLRQAKLAEDEKKDLSKLVKETNKKSAIEMINRIAEIQRHIFITPQQRDELAKYTEFATRIVSDACVQSDDEIYKLLQKCNKKIESINNDGIETYSEFKNTIDELNKKRSELENANLSTEMRNQVTELKLESRRLVEFARTHNFDKDKIAQISTKLDELKILQINLEANHSAHSETTATPYTSLGQDDEVSISKPESMQISIATNQSTFFSESIATAYASIDQDEKVMKVKEPKRMAAAVTGGRG